jgi:dihydroorotate dehydrogenase electron transfer subunit
MSVDAKNGTFDLLYKVVGEGTRQLSQRKVGDMLSVIGPIGNGFRMTNKKLPLLIGGGVGIPPMIAIAQHIKDSELDPFVILGSEVAFPFSPSLLRQCIFLSRRSYRFKHRMRATGIYFNFSQLIC